MDRRAELAEAVVAAPAVVPAWRYRLRDFRVVQKTPGGEVVDTVKARSPLRALRIVELVPGARVRVSVPIVVLARRAGPR